VSRKRYTSEQIVGLLRKAEARLSQGEKVGVICRVLGIAEAENLGVRFCANYVCFTPRSGHSAGSTRCPLMTRSGLFEARHSE